jgi:PAS domain S-box-containing protein
MGQDDRLRQRNAELEFLVQELQAQLQANSLRQTDSAHVPHASESQVTQLESAIGQLEAEVLRRKWAQESLRASEERYRSVVAAMHEGVLMLSADGTIQTCNASAEKILECSANELIGSNVLDLNWQALHEDHAPFDLEDFPGLMTARTGIPCSEVILGLRKSAKHVTWISVNSQPLFRSGDLLPYAVVVSFSDVTLRKWVEQERAQLLEREQAARAEAELAREQISQILQSITDGFIALDRESRFTYVNHEAARTLGRSPLDLLGKNLWEEFPDFGNSSFGRVYRRALAEGVPLEIVDYYEPWDCWYSVRAYPSKSGISLYFRNMTDSVKTAHERDQAQASLREGEERFRQLAENIPQIFWMYDLETERLSYVSPVSKQVVGYEPYQCYGEDLAFWLGHIVAADVESVKRTSQRVLVGDASEVTFRFTRPDGQQRWLLARAFPIRNAQGRVYRVAGIAEDISDRKHREERLRLLESVIVNANDAVVITEAEPVEPPGPRIIYVNDAFTRMMGYSAEEVTGKTPRILQGPNTDLEVLKEIRTALKNWQPAIAELVNYHKDGSEVWIELSIFPVSDETGNYTYWVGLQRDITQRKEAEAEMQRALEKERELSELKSRFVSTTSHEFRTPLSTILSSADLLEFYAGDCSQEKQIEHLHRIQAAAINMNNLLNDVLMIERAEAKKMRFEPIDLDLRFFCKTIVEELRLNDSGKHRLVFQSSTTEPIKACMDEKLLRQIFTNLITNALKYSPIGSMIKVRLETKEAHALIEVQDEGIGIPPSDQLRLFEPFHRGDNVGTISGNGLGLAIVKQSLDAHGGQISVTSRENHGTVMHVSLPLDCRIS